MQKAVNKSLVTSRNNDIRRNETSGDVDAGEKQEFGRVGILSSYFLILH